MKQVKRFEVLETTPEDTAIAFWFTDGTKQILVVKNDEIKKLSEELKLEVKN